MNISLSFPAAEPAISSFLFHKLKIDIEFKEIQTKDAEAWEALSYHTCIYYMTYSDGRFFSPLQSKENASLFATHPPFLMSHLTNVMDTITICIHLKSPFSLCVASLWWTKTQTHHKPP